MKKALLVFVLCSVALQHIQSQEWMESLDVAKRLALRQNKLILMVWEGATYYPLPVTVKDSTGRVFMIRDVFSDATMLDVLWDYFVPVKINDLFYADMYAKVKKKHKSSYLTKFNDDSIKIMDANGVIIGTSGTFTDVLNLSQFISNYAINTSFLKSELQNYTSDNNVYSAYYLGSKYIDFSVFLPKKMRYALLEVSHIYLNEAKLHLQSNMEASDKKEDVLQRIHLTELKQELVKGNARRVLRRLTKMEADTITNTNASLVTFLYYTAYRLLNNTKEFAKLEGDISLANLRHVQSIVNINR